MDSQEHVPECIQTGKPSLMTLAGETTDVENVSWLLYKGCLYFFIP